jgi:N-methylhydantoinase A/oxoprolinase/acetone carboxylase beta subunit
MEVHFDCRYSGQSHDLRVESVEAFHDEHRRVNGYARPGDPVEVTAVRVAVMAAAPMDLGDVMAPMVGGWGNDVVTGPRVLSTQDCTIWIPEGWQGSEGALGSLVLRRVGDSRGTPDQDPRQ